MRNRLISATLLLILIPFTSVFGQGNVLRNFLTADECSKACVLGIEPGMAPEEFEVILGNAAVEYTTAEIGLVAPLTVVYYAYVPIPSELIRYNTDIPVSITLNHSGEIAQLLIPIEVSVDSILEAFGNPAFLGNSVGVYTLGYPELGMFFIFPKEESEYSSRVLLRNSELSQNLMQHDLPLLPCAEPANLCGLTIAESPTASVGPDQTLTDTDSSGSELVTLDGSGSFDPDGTIVSYYWTENDVEIATGATPTVELGIGVHTITLTVTDDDGLTASDEVVVTVEAARRARHEARPGESG